MGGRARLYVQAEASLGQGESIFFQKLMPYNSTFLQIQIHWTSLPTTGEDFCVIKRSVSGPLFDILIRCYNPVVGMFKDIICNDHFEFRKGDTLELTYANTDDLGVGAVCVLKEAD